MHGTCYLFSACLAQGVKTSLVVVQKLVEVFIFLSKHFTGSNDGGKIRRRREISRNCWRIAVTNVVLQKWRWFDVLMGPIERISDVSVIGNSV